MLPNGCIFPKPKTRGCFPDDGSNFPYPGPYPYPYHYPGPRYPQDYY